VILPDRGFRQIDNERVVFLLKVEGAIEILGGELGRDYGLGAEINDDDCRQNGPALLHISP
jgi:hypothetical protein